jgi:hypothetical protein
MEQKSQSSHEQAGKRDEPVKIASRSKHYRSKSQMPRHSVRQHLLHQSSLKK